MSFDSFWLSHLRLLYFHSNALEYSSTSKFDTLEAPSLDGNTFYVLTWNLKANECQLTTSMTKMKTEKNKLNQNRLNLFFFLSLGTQVFAKISTVYVPIKAKGWNMRIGQHIFYCAHKTPFVRAILALISAESTQ